MKAEDYNDIRATVIEILATSSTYSYDDWEDLMNRRHFSGFFVYRSKFDRGTMTKEDFLQSLREADLLKQMPHAGVHWAASGKPSISKCNLRFEKTDDPNVMQVHFKFPKQEVQVRVQLGEGSVYPWFRSQPFDKRQLSEITPYEPGVRAKLGEKVQTVNFFFSGSTFVGAEIRETTCVKVINEPETGMRGNTLITPSDANRWLCLDSAPHLDMDSAESHLYH